MWLIFMRAHVHVAAQSAITRLIYCAGPPKGQTPLMRTNMLARRHTARTVGTVARLFYRRRLAAAARGEQSADEESKQLMRIVIRWEAPRRSRPRRELSAEWSAGATVVTALMS